MNLKYFPSNQKEVTEYRDMLSYLRNIGQKKIMERIEAFKNNEHIPNDILSAILKGNSNDNNLLYIQ